MIPVGIVCHRKHLSAERLTVIGVASNVAMINDTGFYHAVSTRFFNQNYVVLPNLEEGDNIKHEHS